MRAVRIEAPGQPVVDRDVPSPAHGPNEVLVEVRAAGICHSDAHYRAGRSASLVPPITPGHEVAGVVRAVGRDVTTHRVGDRVCLHYLVTCGHCAACVAGRESWCTTGRMLGHHRDGGWAEAIVVPARNAVPLPDEITFAHGAVLMCSSATALHALRRGRLAPGDTVAVVGIGGLGISAVQLARALGARAVYAIDPNPAKREAAARYGAIPIAAGPGDDPVTALRAHTGGSGVDVSLELVGRPESMQTALRAAGVQGRAVIAGLSRTPMTLDTYRDLLGPEVELIGANDHLLAELPLLLDLARRRALDLTEVVTREVPLEAAAINGVLDALEAWTAPLRTVITPEGGR
ncbi:MAG: zinc-binding dehydrogenase [Gemmatimonadaceae bacterium]|jgi:propanol-preferring alcohol dehydrogenase|nr:zinc-binding dehydrogenase [Gemmatimonadaceae bacterium]